MNNLTPKEIKAIFLVHNKADYRNVSQLKDSFKIIQQRKILQSSKALRYKKRLALLCKGKKDYSCVFCKDKKTQGKGVICPWCENLLTNLLNGERIDEKIIKNRIKERKSQAVSNALSLSKGLGILAVILSVLMLAGTVYMLFTSWATYDELCNKALMIPQVSEYLTDKSAKPVESSGEELFGYIGASYDTLSKKLGESTTMIGDNIRYFETAGASVIINSDTSVIEYIDIDGTGSMPVTLMGITNGMMKEDVLNTLYLLGLQEPSAVSGSTYEYYFRNEDETSSVVMSVTFVNDIVTLVSAQLR